MARKVLNPVELAALIASMYSGTVTAGDYSATYNELTKVLNKIGLQIQLQNEYIDRLPEMDGPELPAGKIIEEYFEELPAVLDYDKTGSTNDSPEDPHFLKPYYSYPLPRKFIKTTRRYEEYEASAISVENIAALAGDELAKITKSTDVFRYALKRELLGTAIKQAELRQSGLAAAGVATYVAASANTLELGALVCQTQSATAAHGVVMVDKGGIPANTSWADAVAAGYIVVFDLVEAVAKPTSTEEGEAFIMKVMDDVEIARENGQGHSLNGAFIGSTSDLMLYTLPKVNSVLSVKVKAGAFHREDLEIGAMLKSIPNFGSYNGKAWAVLIDPRMCVLYLDYLRDRVHENADGDFVNFVRHLHNTPFISTATFIKVYVEPEAASEGAGD